MHGQIVLPPAQPHFHLLRGLLFFRITQAKNNVYSTVVKLNLILNFVNNSIIVTLQHTMTVRRHSCFVGRVIDANVWHIHLQNLHLNFVQYKFETLGKDKQNVTMKHKWCRRKFNGVGILYNSTFL